MATDGPAALRVIVVGASAGGVQALSRLAAGLPPDLPAAVAVVLHVPPSGHSVLHQILQRAGPLPCDAAQDGEALRAGHIYVGPPDRHLVLDDREVRLTRGPKENGHRPAIDPLFASAARTHGPRAIGVILSGTLDDGTAGLAAIKLAGGTTVVQDPEDALYPGMPSSAIERVAVDHVVALDELASLLSELVGDVGPEPEPLGGAEPLVIEPHNHKDPG
jgi:two-component system, chemotaxis family, protein-glutamate methylesterase/glutaminase